MKRFAILVLLLPALSVAAQGDVAALQRAALRDNPSLAAARLKWEAAKARAGGERSLPDPMIGADWERDNTRFGDRMGVEYMLQQDLPGWGKRAARTEAARLAAEAEGFRYLEAARSLRAEVDGAWWELWARTQTVGAMGGSVEAMRQMEHAALARYESGTAMLAEVLRVQADLARMTNDWLTMRREVDVARVALNRLLNAPVETPREVPGDPADPDLPESLENLQRQARLYCCILMSYLREQEARAAAARAARAERRPDWQVRVEARQFDGSGSLDEYDTGVFLNVPWLWRGKYHAAIREAEADRAMAEAEYQDEVNKTLWEIQELYTMAEADHRLAGAYRDAIRPRLADALESTLAAYRSGQATALEVQESARALREAEIQHIRTRARFAQTAARLNAIAAPWGEFERASGLVTDDMK